MKPDLLIINLDFPGTLDSNAGYGYEREQFFPFILDDSLITNVSKDKKITLLDRYLPLHRYFGNKEDIRNGLSSFFGKQQFEDGGMYKGFRSNSYAWTSGSLSLDTLFCAPLEAPLITELDSFVRSRKEEGINVVMVEFPEYYRLRKKFKNVNDVEAVFRDIAERNQVTLLDYSSADICYDSTNYYNPSHLNSKGSVMFTRMLCLDLDSLGYKITRQSIQ